MKKINFQKKLSLTKETVSNLSNPEMKEVEGGLVGHPKTRFDRTCYLLTACVVNTCL